MTLVELMENKPACDLLIKAAFGPSWSLAFTEVEHDIQFRLFGKYEKEVSYITIKSGLTHFSVSASHAITMRNNPSAPHGFDLVSFAEKAKRLGVSFERIER